MDPTWLPRIFEALSRRAMAKSDKQQGTFVWFRVIVCVTAPPIREVESERQRRLRLNIRLLS